MHINPDTQAKFKIYHSDKNVIKIDSESDKGNNSSGSKNISGSNNSSDSEISDKEIKSE